MAVGWWRSRQDKTKRKLIDDGFPWKYTQEDAARARTLLLELTNSEEHAYYIMKDCACAFIDHKLPEDALLLFQEALNFVAIPALEKGILHENLATYLRNGSNPKLIVQEMKKALKWYGKADDLYRVCVALKNLGEAEWILSFKKTATQYFDKSEELCNKLDQSKKADVFWNLACAARRIGETRMEINYLTKCLLECSEEQSELILEVDKRLSKIT